jgi:hypothetical protein
MQRSTSVVDWLCKQVHDYAMTWSVSVSGTIRKTLMAGSSFNVTWHLSYPHRVSSLSPLHESCPATTMQVTRGRRI